ncbi:MAG: alpha/beta hydrolase domain-containing protein [Paracoccaceae bacterium]
MRSELDYVVSSRKPFADGAEFGDAGACEMLQGRVRFGVDPRAAAQSVVTDIGLAPVDDKGLVRFEADFAILRPVELARGNGRVFFDYGNRGNKRALQFFNDAPSNNNPMSAADAGNGFLMRRGYSVAWLAWQGDLLPGDGRMLLDLPVATDQGRAITGTVRAEYISVEEGRQVFPLSTLVSTRSYPAASLDTSKARLTRRRYALSQREEIAQDKWAFARIEQGGGVDNQGMERAVVPSDSHLYLAEGFTPGWIYELIYEGREPLVLGLGHVAVRNFISFLKNDETTSDGAPNPLRDKGARIEKAYAWGRSQTGRCIRDFLHLGFNADEAGRRTFDGVMPHVAGAGKMWMNQRFANLVLLPGQEHENHFSPADRFPFSYARTKDHLTGREDAILRRPDTDPLVIHTDTACEYWHRRASLVHTTTTGEDLAQPDNVRVYLWGSSQHFAEPHVPAPSRGIAQTYFNVVATSMFFRALLDRLDEWATDGTPPPPSRIPSRAGGTLATADEWRASFPAIPGVAPPRGPSRLELLDFGDKLEQGLITKEPPEILADKRYAVLVPAVDEDGNDASGLLAPMVQAPLGTYTGWSVRQRRYGAGAMVGITGSYIPFPDDEEERRQTGDPRPSILQRYGDLDGYMAAIDAAATALAADGLMLDEDLARCAEEAKDWGRPRHEVGLPRHAKGA